MPQTEPVQRQRSKSRPAFEVPVETGMQAAVGWVYREKADNADAADEVVPPQRAPANPIEMVATGLVLVGVGTVGVGVGTVGGLSLAALGLITAPIRIASAICTRRL